MSTWDEPDFSPPFAPSTERLVPRIPSLAEQRAQIAERCRIRDLWPQTIIHGRNAYDVVKDCRGTVRKIAP
jgi:hypothetical protein